MLKLPALIRILSIPLLLSAGCASSITEKHIRQQGEVLREYEQGGHTYYVVRAGNLVRKWDQAPNGAAGVLYEVDTVTKTCKVTNSIVECANVKNDADMAPYITW